MELTLSVVNYIRQVIVFEVQQHLVVGYKACTTYMQLLLPIQNVGVKLLAILPIVETASKFMLWVSFSS